MPPVSAVTVVALVVSILALALSGIAITWQIVSWRYTGSVVKAELVAGAAGRGGLVSSSIKNWNPHLVRSQGFSDLQVGVRVRNVGRTAADIETWSIKSTGGWGYSLPGYHLNKDTPIRLEPGSQKGLLGTRCRYRQSAPSIQHRQGRTPNRALRQCQHGNWQNRRVQAALGSVYFSVRLLARRVIDGREFAFESLVTLPDARRS